MRQMKQRRSEGRKSRATNRGSGVRKNSIDLTDIDPANNDAQINENFQHLPLNNDN